MRLLPFPSFLFAFLVLSGCSGHAPSSTSCDAATHPAVISEVRGSDFVVENGRLILHTAGASQYSLLQGKCLWADRNPPAPGMRLLHDADQIAESYPAQAWPT